MRIIGHLIFLGAALGMVGLVFRPLRSRAVWTRWIFFTISGLFLVLGICGLAVDLHYWNFSSQAWFRFERQMQFVRGLIIGCFFVLLVSGELFGKKISRAVPAAYQSAAGNPDPDRDRASRFGCCLEAQRCGCRRKCAASGCA